jgi:hypothetical protein
VLADRFRGALLAFARVVEVDRVGKHYRSLHHKLGEYFVVSHKFILLASFNNDSIISVVSAGLYPLSLEALSSELKLLVQLTLEN